MLSSPSWTYSLLLMTGSENLDDEVDNTDTVVVDEFRSTAQLALLRLRWFPSPTFFVSAGAGVRRLSFHIAISDREDAGRAITEAEATSLVASTSIGNQWSWSNGFFLGADWIGYTVPLVKTYSSRVETEGAATDELSSLSATAEDAARELGSVPSILLLVVEAGLRF
jgi:hypothetical protein